MFFKLVKTDFKYHSRSFFMIMMSVLLANILMLFSKGLKWRLSKNVLELLAIVFLVVAIFGTIVVVLKVFSNKFVSNESYLTFSLPVKRYYHIWSNLVVSTVWMMIIGAISFLSVMLWLYIWVGKVGMNSFIESITSQILPDGFHTFSFIFSALCGSITGTFLMYLCVSIVNVGVLKHRPLISGIFVYFAIHCLQMTIITQVLRFCQEKFDLDCLDNQFGVLLLITSAIVILFGIAYYMLLLHIINKKLEVD